MRNTLSISFKDTKHTEHLVLFIENKFKRIKRMNPKIIQCNIVVSAPHNNKRNGNRALVSIHIKFPKKEIAVKRQTDPSSGTDLYAAISDGFHKLEMQLKPKVNKRLSFQNFKNIPHFETSPTAG